MYLYDWWDDEEGPERVLYLLNKLFPPRRDWRLYPFPPGELDSLQFEALNARASDMHELENRVPSGVKGEVAIIYSSNFLTTNVFHFGKKETPDPYGPPKDEEPDHEIYSLSAMYSPDEDITINARATLKSTRGWLTIRKSNWSLWLSGMLSAEENKSQYDFNMSYRVLDAILQLKMQGPAIGASYSLPVSNVLSLGGELFASPINGLSRQSYVVRYANETFGTESVFSYTTGLGADVFY